MIKKINKNQSRQARQKRVRKKISGTSTCPRLNVYRSTTNIYAQIIDDVNGVTLASASSLEKEVAAKVKGVTKVKQAEIVGEIIAKRAIEKNITNVVFDRAGYLYAGRVKQLAEAARNAGLKF